MQVLACSMESMGEQHALGGGVRQHPGSSDDVFYSCSNGLACQHGLGAQSLLLCLSPILAVVGFGKKGPNKQ